MADLVAALAAKHHPRNATVPRTEIALAEKGNVIRLAPTGKPEAPESSANRLVNFTQEAALDMEANPETVEAEH